MQKGTDDVAHLLVLTQYITNPRHVVKLKELMTNTPETLKDVNIP